MASELSLFESFYFGFAFSLEIGKPAGDGRRVLGAHLHFLRLKRIPLGGATLVKGSVETFFFETTKKSLLYHWRQHGR